MTPQQKLKKEIILEHFRLYPKSKLAIEVNKDVIDSVSVKITEDTVDLIYKQLEESEDLGDARNEVRNGNYETDIKPPYSRVYECKIVASKMSDDSYVA